MLYCLETIDSLPGMGLFVLVSPCVHTLAIHGCEDLRFTSEHNKMLLIIDFVIWDCLKYTCHWSDGNSI